MASGQGLVVEGLKETRQRIKKLSPEADKQFKVALRELQQDVVDDARSLAKAKGLVAKGGRPANQKGRLVTGIKRGGLSMEKAEIKSTAYREYKKPEGRGPEGKKKYGYQRRRNRSGGLIRSYVGKDFVYPMVYEYGGRGGNLTGPRAFLNPALMKSRDKIIARFDKALEDASVKAGFK